MELKDFIIQNFKTDELVQQLQHDNISKEQKEQINAEQSIEQKIVLILKTITDPEMSVNIWDLGLIYNINVINEDVNIDMTLTAPTCPIAGLMPMEVKKRIQKYAKNIRDIEVNMVWKPRWNKDMMSDDAKLILDMW